MKLSIYNSVLQIDDKVTLVFNALSDNFVAVKTSGFDLPHTSQAIRNLERDSPMLFNQLLEIDAFVEESTDEVEILKRRIEEIDNDDRFFIMHINPTLDCNFNCWYCYENHHKGSMISEKVVEKILLNCQRIISQSPNLQVFNLCFFGGEPLLGFSSVKKLMEEVAAICAQRDIAFKVGFTSNAFLLTKTMVDFLQQFECSFQITIDGGRVDHDNTRFSKGGVGSYDVILRNVHILAAANIDVVLRVNYTSGNVESTMEIFDWLKSLPENLRDKIKIDYQRVWQDKPEEGIDETYIKVKAIRRKIQMMGFRVMNNRILRGVQESCYGDKRNHVLVNYDGNLFGCTARDFTEDNRIGVIGQEEFEWDSDKYDLWYKSRFSNIVCHTCRIAPLCGGGCRQQAVDHYGEENCILGYSDAMIDEFILERFEDLVMNKISQL